MKKGILFYLMVTGIVANMMLIGLLIYIEQAVDQPAGFLLEKTVNYYAYRSYGLRKKMARSVLNHGFIDDWGRPPSSRVNPFPTLNAWKGQGASETALYSSQAYADDGRPTGAKLVAQQQTSDANTRRVAKPKALIEAIRRAKPGEIILIAPGRYTLGGDSIPVTRPGRMAAPITIKAERLGQVTLNLKTLEGFHIKAPYWVFENLDIQGVCKNDNRCEHAFHVVGNGRAFVLRNSRIADFNAPIKVNGSKISGKRRYPDDGLIEYNSFVNSRPRNTGSSVTLLNIDNVNGWVVRGNLIGDFSKLQSDRTSYGAFMKGNGRDGLFERNLVICEMNLPADQGIRIGLSFGGGGTGKRFCRDGDCPVEFSNGILRNNVILNCSHDVGIYINKSEFIGIYNNLIYNALGIDVRFNGSSTTIVNNLISGRIRGRDGGLVLQDNNRIYAGCLKTGFSLIGCPFEKWYADVAAGDLTLREGEDLIGQGVPIDGLKDDFCGHPRNGVPDIGPIQYADGLPGNCP